MPDSSDISVDQSGETAYRRQQPRPPDNVKLFIGVLYRSESVYQQAEIILERKFGVIDLRDVAREFLHTEYYEKEMGAPLYRCYIAFRELIHPGELSHIKLFTNMVEDRFRGEAGKGGRLINLDPGYVSHGSVVLATTKNYSHRIYIGQGIFGDVHMQYGNKTYRPQQWTYPDYKDKLNVSFFNTVRTRYLEQLAEVHL